MDDINEIKKNKETSMEQQNTTIAFGTCQSAVRKTQDDNGNI